MVQFPVDTALTQIACNIIWSSSCVIKLCSSLRVSLCEIKFETHITLTNDTDRCKVDCTYDEFHQVLDAVLLIRF